VVVHFEGHEIEADGYKLIWKLRGEESNKVENYLELKFPIGAIFPFEGDLLVLTHERSVYRVRGWWSWDEAYSSLRVERIGRLNIQ